MSVQIKKNGVWEAVAGNATNTSGITESSALANIGTSANATQHDINVALNDNALLSKADSVEGGQTFNGDLNDLTSPGVYSLAATSHIPKPGPFYGTALVYKGKFNYLNQEVMDVIYARKWVRTRTENGNWSKWIELTAPKTVSLYINTSDLGITVGSTITVEAFVHSLWDFLITLYPQSEYFNINGMMNWENSNTFYITDGNYTVMSSGTKFDFFIRYALWSNNSGTLLTAGGEAFLARCNYLNSVSDFQQSIQKFTLT